MQNTAKIGNQDLHFGNYAIRRFCRLQECTNDPTSILMEFAGDKRADALLNLVRAGLEAQYAKEEKPFDLTEFKISEFVDKLKEKDDKGESVINAFIGSVIDKPATEVPDWIKEVEAEAKKQAQKEFELLNAQESPNAEAGQPSPPAKKSKPAPSDTASSPESSTSSSGKVKS